MHRKGMTDSFFLSGELFMVTTCNQLNMSVLANEPPTYNVLSIRYEED